MKDISYKEKLNNLMYAMVTTIPYLYNAINIISQFMFDPSIEHWVAATNLLVICKPSYDIRHFAF
jgi:hypothetical protein